MVNSLKAAVSESTRPALSVPQEERSAAPFDAAQPMVDVDQLTVRRRNIIRPPSPTSARLAGSGTAISVVLVWAL